MLLGKFVDGSMGLTGYLRVMEVLSYFVKKPEDVITPDDIKSYYACVWAEVNDLFPGVTAARVAFELLNLISFLMLYAGVQKEWSTLMIPGKNYK